MTQSLKWLSRVALVINASVVSASAATLPEWSQKLVEARQASSEIMFPPGTYRIEETVAPPLNVPLEFIDTVFAGRGSILHLGDWSAFLHSPVSHAWSRVTDYPGNDWGTLTTLSIARTKDSPSYEKAAGYDVVETRDPSSYTRSGDPVNANRDAVGRQMNANILSGNLKGRAWGASANVGVERGADGTAIGFEADITNEAGIDQPLPSTPTTKTGVTAVCMGSTKCTSGFFPIGNGSQFHVGYDGIASSFSDYFIGLRSGADARVFLMSVDRRGTIKGSGFVEKLTTPASSSAPCTAGQFTDDADYHYVCVASNKWRPVALSDF